MKAARQYSADLAWVHSQGFTSLAESAGRWLARSLKKQGLRGGLVVDVGCGDGALARPLLEAGFEVLGVDVSPGMVRLARRREPGARFRVADFATLRLPRCVAVAAVGECLSYRFVKGQRPGAVDRFFRRVFAGLHPGGLLVFDVVAEAHGRPESRVSWREDPGRGWCVCVRVDEGPSRRLVRRRITTFRRVERSYRRTDEVHVQRRLDRVRIGASLRGAGFRAREIRGYGAVRFRPGCAGFVAEKPFAS